MKKSGVSFAIEFEKNAVSNEVIGSKKL